MVKKHIVSFFPSIFKPKDGFDTDIYDLLQNIKSGLYEDVVYPVRICKDKNQRKDLKPKAPAFATSGT